VANPIPARFAALVSEEEIACDISFRIAGDDNDDEAKTIKAHRCVLDARQCSLLQPLQDDIVVDPSIFAEGSAPPVECLRGAIATCYGIHPGAIANQISSCMVNVDVDNLVQDFARLDPYTTNTAEDSDVEFAMLVTMFAPPTDVKLVGSPSASADTDVEWTVHGHGALLCAHSDYFQSALTHSQWSTTTETKSDNDASTAGNNNTTAAKVRILRLDSTLFTQDMIQELVSACYGTSLDVCAEPIESILHLIDGATYLGMRSASLRCEEALATRIDPTNLADMMHFAETNVAQRLHLECHKYLCRNLATIGSNSHTLKQLSKNQLEAMLQSDFVETPEDEILDVILKWSEQTEASIEDTRTLVKNLRLPFVPVDSNVMNRAVQRDVVSEDMLRLCRLFQTNPDYRRMMINSEPMYRPRQTKQMKEELEKKLRPPSPHIFLGGLRLVRMMAVVNGRENFEKIRSVRKSESGNHLVCAFPSGSNGVASFTSDYPFDFGSIKTKYRTFGKHQGERINQDVLETLDVEDVRQLLVNMLKFEESLRLHPQIQAVYGSMGENEAEMCRFTDALQAHVAQTFDFDAQVGIHLIRSASTLFPETAKLAHYVRHNRCFEGSLKIGDEAPDVSLLTLSGEPTTLWTEVDKRRHYTTTSGFEDSDKMKPVLILGASYT
jgi:hypothetical protein